MKNAAKKIGSGLAGAILVLSSSLLPLAPAYAQTWPYFKEYGGDISTGGWFNSGTTNCLAPGISNFFQDGAFMPNSSTSDAFKSYGGIYTFMRDAGGGGYAGSSSQFAAYSLGTIDGEGSAINGFYTGNISGNKKPLSFANFGVTGPPAGYMGGLWGGDIRSTSNCIPDYYGTKDSSPRGNGASPGFGGGLPNSLSGISTYAVSPGAAVINLFSGNSPVTVNRGAWVTVFVYGNLRINANVNYQGRDPSNNNSPVNNIPRFSVVVKGNIYVAPNVTNLDGLYIAQPDMANPDPVGSRDTGVFWTCDDGSKSSFTAPGGNSWLVSNCNNKLTVNGSVIAKKLYLFRVAGNVSSAPPGETPGPANNTAEEFNYIPEMLLGGPMLPDSNKTNLMNGNKPAYDSVLSLPPIF